MGNRTWKGSALAVPSVGVSMLPKVICPVCSPAYAAMLSSIGLGFLVSTTYLLPVTVILLAVAAAITYAGVGLLVLASVWNVVPCRANTCSCLPADGGATK